MTTPTLQQAEKIFRATGWKRTNDSGDTQAWQAGGFEVEFTLPELIAAAAELRTDPTLGAEALAERVEQGLAQPTPGLLSPDLQERARRYVAARRRTGEALLEAVAELAAARQQAQHGEWGTFLEAVGLDESAARAQIRIHELATADPAYAERIRTGFLTEATARELLSAPPDVRAGLLAGDTPPTREEIREAKREPAPGLTGARSHSQGAGGTGDSNTQRQNTNEKEADRLGKAIAKIEAAGGTVNPLPDTRDTYEVVAPAHCEAINKRLTLLQMEFYASVWSAQPVPALPPAPDGWLLWKDEYTYAIKHESTGLRFIGDDAPTLIAQATASGRYLAVLDGWSVYYDPMSEGRCDLHPWVASRQNYTATSGRTLADLALTIWKQGLPEADYPDLPDEIIDGLWLKGWDWEGKRWRRGLEGMGPGMSLGELRYEAGLTDEEPLPALPAPALAQPAAAFRPPTWLTAATTMGMHVQANKAPLACAQAALTYAQHLLHIAGFPSLLPMLAEFESDLLTTEQMIIEGSTQLAAARLRAIEGDLQNASDALPDALYEGYAQRITAARGAL